MDNNVTMKELTADILRINSERRVLDQRVDEAKNLDGMAFIAATIAIIMDLRRLDYEEMCARTNMLMLLQTETSDTLDSIHAKHKKHINIEKIQGKLNDAQNKFNNAILKRIQELEAFNVPTPSIN